MTQKAKFKLINYLPLLSATVALALIFIFNEVIVLSVVEKKLKLGAIYAAIFDWAAIQTGFLFSVYGYIASKSDGFIGAIRRTTAMSNFNAYIRRATTTGFILTITSMPLVMFSLEPKAFNWQFNLVAIWFALFVWAFISFLRLAYIFGVIVRVPDNRDLPA